MRLLQWLNTVLFAAMVLVNALAEIVPLGGKTTGEISALYPNLFTPAPPAFSLWGLIYLLLLLFILYQWRRGEKPAQALREVGPWFVVSCLMNIGWVLCWHFGAVTASPLCMAGLLVSLLVIERSLSIERHGGLLRRWGAELGFSLYCGWIIAASIANVSAVLVKLGWDGFGCSDTFWTVLMLAVGLLLTVGAMQSIGRCGIGLGVLWAYLWILWNHISPAHCGGLYPAVIAAASGCILCLAAAIYRLRKKQ